MVLKSEVTYLFFYLSQCSFTVFTGVVHFYGHATLSLLPCNFFFPNRSRNLTHHITGTNNAVSTNTTLRPIPNKLLYPAVTSLIAGALLSTASHSLIVTLLTGHITRTITRLSPCVKRGSSAAATRSRLIVKNMRTACS